MGELGCYRELGPTEQYLNVCHSHGNRNICVALTIHTRAPLDLGEVQVGLQEMQHLNPQLTSRIKRVGNREMFIPMECPVLPLDTEFSCRDFLHERFNTETGPLWRVQIVSVETLEMANIAFGPEVEAIIEDDSTIETRWRYFLRYMQGQLNRDIENFSSGEQEEEEGRSVIFISFHPSITDGTGALYLAKQFMDILDMKLESKESPLSLGSAVQFPPPLEVVLPSPDSVFHIKDIVPMVKAVGNHFMQLRRSPCEPLLVDTNSLNRNEPRSRYLRGWLSEAETRELTNQCGVEEVSLHGIVLAAALTALSRICVLHGISSESCKTLRACISTNLRQYCSQSSRNGCYTAPYEETYTVPPEMVRSDVNVTSTDLWTFALALTNAHNTAKANKHAIRHVRMISKIHVTGGMETAFKDMNESRKVDSELHLNILGDLGHIFRRESSPSDETQVRLEDAMLMISGQNMGYPVSHSAHIFRGRLNYTLTYYTNYISTETVFLVRDETINLLRLAAETE